MQESADQNAAAASPTRAPRIVYGGDRKLGVDLLRFLRDQGVQPLGLLLPERGQGSHSEELLGLCGHLDASHVVYGKALRAPESLDLLRSLKPDYIICIHLPTIIPKSILEIPTQGVLNLHPAYLPYSRGWHNSAWAMLLGTPYGATLHFMDEGLDTGDIVHQKQLPIRPNDTGNSAYCGALELEAEVFKEAWPALRDFTYKRTPQPREGGTSHKIKDLAASGLQEIDLDAMTQAGAMIDKLRALTTNRIEEAAYFVRDGRKYRVQVSITESE